MRTWGRMESTVPIRQPTCFRTGENLPFPPCDHITPLLFFKAYLDGADAVKGDFRVSMDNVGVVMHSSPVESYESLNCFGKYVEKMTAAECEQCKMALTDFTFITVPNMLAWADGKVNVMLCVKESFDIPRAISTLIENNATHRAFLEIKIGSFFSVMDTEGWSKVYYVVELGDSSEVEKLLSAPDDLIRRAFLVEFNNWDSWGTSLADDMMKVKARGLRTFAATKDSPVTATVQNHMKLYNAGFDVAYTYNLTNAVEARAAVNAERGIFPARV